MCLIRLEDLRPEVVKALPVGITSENAAHRIAVDWDENGVRKEGVFIWRRDSNSFLNQLAGGRLFPGVHGAATFDIEDDRERISFAMKGADVAISLEISFTTGIWVGDHVDVLRATGTGAEMMSSALL